MEEIKPFITVYVLTFNEEHIITFFIEHYRKMFPNCIINIYDNYSTDNTVEIAKEYGCNIFYFKSSEGVEFLDDREFIKIKNQYWKTATTDWVICCDCDELLYINQKELMLEEELGFNVIHPVGYQMINNKNNDINLNDMEYGVQDWTYSKKILFNKKYVNDINYDYGAHVAYPIGINIKQGSSKPYVLAHYKFISKEFSLKKRDSNNRRWSKWNIEVLWKNFSGHLIYCPNDYWDEWYNKPLVKIDGLKK